MSPLRATVLVWAVAALLTLFKLWLVAAQPLTAAADAQLDDRLFIDLADSILHGHWLGDYGPRTLAKGCGYPLFIAGAHLLHVPLPLAQQILYALACAALALAAAPAFRLRFLPLAIYTVLLFNPMSFEAPVMGRVLRQHLATPAGMLALAGFTGLWLHVRSNYYRRLLWSLAAGAGLAASWFSREEATLLLPAVFLLAAGAALAHRRSWGRGPTWILLLLPWSVWGGATGLVALLNHHCYGAAVTVEFRTPEFAEAYGALTRVRPRVWQQYVPVPREVRERIYAVSPAFRELRDYFEGEPGRNWAALGTALTGQPAEAREIAGGWFMWALRDAVGAAGHCHNAAEALGYYRRLADEVNAACDRGLLDALPSRTGFLPPWNEGYRGPWLDAVREGSHYLIHFDGIHVRPGRSSGDAGGQALFQRITRARLAPPEEGPGESTPLDRARFRMLEAIGRIYQTLHPGLLWVALAGTVGLAVGSAGARWGGLLGLLAALALAVMATVGAIALIHVSCFPAILTGYFHGGYPLMLAFTAVGLAGAADAAGHRYWGRAVA